MLFLAVDGGPIFPTVDPIPLPAPVWLFKLLHDLTLTLHFLAVYVLLGGLLISVVMNFLGHRSRHRAWTAASDVVAGWLPVVMTYVINLGVPPLLFAQVLYGRALYTSSVLIGAYWIAVIPLLIVCYHLLYVITKRAAAEKAWWGYGIMSLVCAAAVARIYTANMTLMIEPTAWRDLYRADQTGTTLVAGPASWLRWLYMMSAAIAGGAVFMTWLSRRKDLFKSAQETLGSVGGALIVPGTLAALVAGVLTWSAQSDAIRGACNFTNPVWFVAVTAWVAGALGMVAAGLVLMWSEPPLGWRLPTLASFAAFVQTAGLVVCRDLVRDAALSGFGLNVWDRAVLVNWSVLLLFLALFVIGLGVVGWMALLAYRGKPEKKPTDTDPEQTRATLPTGAAAKGVTA